MSNPLSTSTSTTSCPCKNVPWSLSSFTAAEYGQVATLTKKQQNNTTMQNISNRQDKYGYTPLHYAAQHNHVAATLYLLQNGALVDGYHSNTPAPPVDSENDGNSTTTISAAATPLHRAAFSGAVATMQILIEWKASLLARDTSFGDGRTPLHKAAAGGRPLAVQLLLQTLRQYLVLSQALQAQDSYGLTPLQVAQDCLTRQEQERSSVARWDEISGGTPADWNTCIALLVNASNQLQEQEQEMDPTHSIASNNDNQSQGKMSLSNQMEFPSLTTTSTTTSTANNTFPRIQPQQHPVVTATTSTTASLGACWDCNIENGTCLTASWQRSFQAALGTSVSMSLRTQTSTNNNAKSIKNNNNTNDNGHNNSQAAAAATTTTTINNNIVRDGPLEKNSLQATATNSSTTMSGTVPYMATSNNVDNNNNNVGICCATCNKVTVALYPSWNGTLVCKACKRQKK